MRIILAVFILFVKVSVAQQFETNHLINLTDLNLKGRVKSVFESSYKGKLVGKDYIKSIKGWSTGWERDKKYIFDSSGNLIEKIYYVNGKIEKNETWKFLNSKVIEINREFFSKSFTYDNEGKIFQEKLINKQPASIKTGNEKPTNGKTSLLSYFYDSIGRIYKKVEKDKKGTILSTETRQYNERGKVSIIEIIRNNSKEWEKYYYDSMNNLNRTEYFDSEDGLAETNIFNYLGSKMVFERNDYYEDGESINFIETKYIDGNVLTITEVDDGKVNLRESYIYEYDKYNNWTKTVATITDKLNVSKIYIMERTIDYYQ